MKRQGKFFDSKLKKGAIILLGIIILFSVIVFAYQKMNRKAEMDNDYPNHPSQDHVNQNETEEKDQIKKLSSGDFEVNFETNTISFNQKLVGGSYCISSSQETPTLKDDWKVIDGNLMSLDEETLTQNNMRVYYMAGDESDVITYDVTNGNGATLMERDESHGYRSYYAIGSYRAFQSAGYKAETIKTINLIDLSITQSPSTYVATWDVSYIDGDNSVTAWLVTNVEDSTMYDLYIGAVGKISAPANSHYLFAYYSKCTQINGLSNLVTNQVMDMGAMFTECSQVTSLDVTEFDTKQVTSMGSMFRNCSKLSNLDVSKFYTSKVTEMGFMFYSCSSLLNLDVSGFDTSNVTNMSYMFESCSELTELDVSKFDTSQVTDMNHTFGSCSSLLNLDVSKFNTSKVTDMAGLFSSCSSLTNLDVSNFDTSKVTTMYSMFYSCRGLSNLNVSNFDTSNVKNMGTMFSSCTNLTSLKLTNFNTSNATDMSTMFSSCTNLIDLDVSSFDTSNVKNMSKMFGGCKNLKSLDLRNFDTNGLDGTYLFSRKWYC